MAIKYEPYPASVIDGQAVLDNFPRTRRTLYYRNSDGVGKRLMRGMPLYDVISTEPVNGGSKDNMLIQGECLTTCAYLKANNIKVDLVYIDPPFASGADYAKKVIVRNKNINGDDLGKDNLDTFEEKMYSDIWNKELYLNWMYENLMAIKSVMSETASIYVHLDWHIGHYVKILLDEVFGENNFRNEIIWYYTNKMTGSTSPHDFVCEHDTIFRYSKGDDYLYNVITELRDEPVKQSKRVKVDGKNMRARDENGEIIYELSTDKKVKDVWEIPYVGSTDSQRADYATQKPISLLERIIQASSNENMTVADFFVGSGTTAIAAQELGRRFIASDININSIQTTRDKLVNLGAKFQKMKVLDGVSLYRNPAQTQDKLEKIVGLYKDSSLGAPWAGYIVNGEYGKMPVYLPSLEQYERTLDKGVLTEIAMRHVMYVPDDVKRVVVYYVDIEDPEEIDKIISQRRNPLVDIDLRDLKELLSEYVSEDDADISEPELITIDLLTKVWQVKVNSFHSERVNNKINEYNNKKQLQVLKAQEKEKKVKYEPILLSDTELETIEWVSLDCTASEGDEWHSDAEVKIEKNCHIRLNGGKETKEYWDGTIRTIDERKPLRIKIRNICGDETIFPL